jgi:predicted homoserine dehydrogenase-like protein
MPINVSPTGLARDLRTRAETGRPIRIGLIGSGEMGTDIVARVAHMEGIEIGAISELNPVNAAKAVDIAFREKGHSREASNTDAVNAAIESGKVAITSDANAILNSGLIDVVIDATGIPAVGAEIGLRAMEHGKHLVMMNVEADVTIGAYLKSEADRLGVTYSLGAGDEPSSCMELIEFVSAMGHRIVAAGKGKNNPLNIDATPPAYEEEAARRHMNVRMLVEFVDGSKTMVEMAAIANATGLVPDVAGMHGPAAMLDQHLTSLEVPLTCARVVLYGKPDMVPLAKPVAEVCAVAKKDMAVGEKLDQIGEFCYRAWVMETAVARADGAIPCGLLAGGTVTAPIRKGELITYANAKPAEGSRIAALRARQDELVYGLERV